MMMMRMNVLKVLENMMIEKVSECIDRCGDKYGIDMLDFKEEMMREMKMKVKSTKIIKEKVIVSTRGGIVLPWSSKICEGKCESLRLNHGLYSQCMNMKKDEDSNLCVQCDKQREKNETGKPDYGMYVDRESWEYVDVKGKNPVSYLKVMLKNGWSREQVEEAALIQGVTIDERHFEVSEAKKRGKKVSVDKVIKEKKSRGRPKKEMKIVEKEDEMGDLFAQLQQEVSSVQIVPVVSVPKIVVPLKKKGETEDERVNRKKLEKLAAKEDARLAQLPVQVHVNVVPVQDDSSTGSSKKSSKNVNLISLAASAKKEQDKLAKEAIAAEKLAQKELERIQKEVVAAEKLAQKELEKEALAVKKEQDKVAKEIATAAKLAQKELERIQKEAVSAEKISQKALEKAKKTAAVVQVPDKVQVSVSVPVPVVVEEVGSSMSSLTCDELEEEVDSSDSESESDNDSEIGDDEEAVEPFRYEVDGVIYLRSRESNTVYTTGEQELVGKWNPETKRIELAVEVEEGDCSDSDDDSDSD